MQQSPDRADDGLIYDVGAHLGEDSGFYLQLGYRVVAIEANPELAATLRDRFAAQQADGCFTLVEGAVSAESGKVTFFVSEHSTGWSTADPEWAARNALAGAPSRRITVNAVSLVEVLHAHGMPRYLKLDIEGGDARCLAALEEFRARPKFVSLEASIDDWRSLVAELNILEQLGYHRFKIVRQGCHPARTFRARNGGDVAVTFDEHASGPFGDDLPGRWLTRAQTLRRYRGICLGQFLVSDRFFLGRVLLRLPLLRRLPRSLAWYDTHAAR